MVGGVGARDAELEEAVQLALRSIWSPKVSPSRSAPAPVG